MVFVNSFSIKLAYQVIIIKRNHVILIVLDLSIPYSSLWSFVVLIKISRWASKIIIIHAVYIEWLHIWNGGKSRRKDGKIDEISREIQKVHWCQKNPNVPSINSGGMPPRPLGGGGILLGPSLLRGGGRLSKSIASSNGGLLSPRLGLDS